MAKSASSFSADSFFDELISEGISSFEGGGEVSIVEFAEEFIFNGKEQLYPTQRAILKSFYNEPLNPEEVEILNSWKEDDRTSWIEGRKYRNMAIEIGRRGTKSSMISVIVMFEFYKLLSLSDPAKHYGLLPNSPIAIFVIAQSQEQVKETLFAQIKGYAENSNYFKGLQKAGKIEILQEEIRCNSKNIGVYAKHTNSKALVGYSLKLLVVDEAARFESDEHGNSKAELVYSNIGRATSTFGPEGFKIAISSAWEDGDYIQQLYNLSKKDPSTLGFRLRTWDTNLNPNMSEAFLKASEDYIRDPITAALEYEGVRFSKQGTFFDSEKIDDAFRGNTVIDALQIPLDIRNEVGELRHYVGVKSFRLEELSAGSSFLHVDYGVKKDGAAVAFCKAVSLPSGKFGIQVDGLLLWKPHIGVDKYNKAVKRIVSFINAEEIILEVCKKRKVITASFDSFQSQHTIQKLHVEGIHTVEMSTSNEMQLLYYNTTRTLLNQGLLILPQDCYCTSEAKGELIRIIQKPSGRVDHTANGCFTGETRIPLLDGTRPTIEELCHKTEAFWVYSCKQDGTFVPGKARARITKYTSELVDVVLDSGAVIRCTPNHPFMKIDGQYIQAKDIIPGITRLMPINFNWPINQGYERISGINGRQLTHHNDPTWKQKLSQGTVAFNKLAETREKRSRYMKSKDREWYKNKARKYDNFRSDITIEGLLEALEFGCENSNQAGHFLKGGRNVIIRILKDYTYSNWEEFANSRNVFFDLNKKDKELLTQLADFREEEIVLITEVAKKTKRSWQTITRVLREQGYKNWEDFIQYGKGQNHKVREIIPVHLALEVPVYDLEVEEWDNFALAAGVIVHNSKDLSDAITNCVYNCYIHMIASGMMSVQAAGVQTIASQAQERVASLSTPLKKKVATQRIKTLRQRRVL